MKAKKNYLLLLCAALASVNAIIYTAVILEPVPSPNLGFFLFLKGFIMPFYSFVLAVMIFAYVFTVDLRDRFYIKKLKLGEKYSICSSFRDEEYNWFLIMINENSGRWGIYQISKEEMNKLAKDKRKESGLDNPNWNNEIVVAVKEEDNVVLIFLEK